ncbi:response regulator [Flavobacterium piscis]|uniref:CheY-like chemotaxis protein n=1 Tax=Flavobacterium piscis TaxID=1114874 RepID=A0ABU1Y9Z6_9FLAO|nr:response regulator [Flavobacterium piscis]MDR7211047.1 CheY-like chemotaxis protein [Flavobacterium piscis]
MKYKNILQIDDDYDDCEFFEQALKTVSNASYTAVNNPLDALRLLINKEIKPDLIFMDVNMPLMSGPELLTEIKKREITKNIPVIMLSTSSLLSKNYEKVLGAKDYLIKPNTFNELKNLIRNTLI